MNFPFSDTYMKYNIEEHRYVLTERYTEERMNLSLREMLNTSISADSASEVERFLDRVSALVYNYIYRMNPFQFRTEKMLAKEPLYRDILRKAMDEQILYIIQNGDISLYSGVNAISHSSMAKSRMRQSEIAPGAQDLLINSKIICISFKPGEKDIKPEYDTEEY